MICIVLTNIFVSRSATLRLFSPKLIHSGIAGKTGVIYDVLIFDTDHFFNNTAASELFIKPIYDNSIIFENKTSSPEIVSQFKAIVGEYKKNGQAKSAYHFRLHIQPVGTSLHPLSNYSKIAYAC